MNHQKKFIIAQYRSSLDGIQQLNLVQNEKLRKPISEGQWSVIEIIGHLLAWDVFILEKRITYLLKNEQLPSSPNVQQMNDQAAQQALKKVPSEVIGDFVKTRTRLINAIETMAEKTWNTEIKINDSRLNFPKYFLGLLDHDNHHLLQIQEFMRSDDSVE